MSEEEVEHEWNNIRLREDEELDFFTELALHETERWIQAITRKKFAYPDDFRKSLSNGVLLCDVLNELKPGTIRKINKLPGAISGLDNLSVFLNACEKQFGLTRSQLFDPNDLEDLSQRAIADEDEELLKQEVDRRSRNVAITIFWLGKKVAGTISGPTLDTSAFSALVHNHGNKNVISDDCFKNESWQQTENLLNQQTSNKVQSFSQHTRDSSYDSLGSYGPESDVSFDDLDGNMPVRSDMRGEMKRAGSTGSLSRDHQLRLPSGNDSVFDKYDSRYGSSPDISHAHTRSSSTDSVDGGYSHSRQSSGSTDSYATRRLSSSSRKTSTSTDPLQFVKASKAEDLAKTAIQQMEATKVVNKMRPVVESAAVNEDQDWQSNFDSWKSKRRQSTPSFQKIGEAEGLFKEEETEKPIERKTKTFSQMMADKNKRKSLGNLSSYPMDDDYNKIKGKSLGNLNSYPIDDDDDKSSEIKSSGNFNSYPIDDNDSGFGNSKSERMITKSTSNKSESQPKKKISKKEEVAPWARNSSDDGGESQSDSETNNSHQSGDTDSVFSDKSIPKVLSDDDSWVKNKTSSQTNSNRFTAPKIDKPLSASRKVWENSVQGSEKRDDRKKVVIPRRSGERNIKNIKDAFEQKEKEAHTAPEIARRPNRLSSSDKAWKSMDLSNTSSSSGYSFSEKPPSPLSPKSPPALAPRNSRYSSPSQSKYGSLPRDTRLSESSKDKPFTEKTIKINQKPNNHKGFGFTLSGGVEKRLPVTVQRVNLGSAADVCEVEANDELISVNGRDVSSLTLAQVQGIVEHSVKRGQIELKIKRFMEDGSYDSVEEEESANQNRMDTQSSDASSLSADLTSEDTYKPEPKVLSSHEDNYGTPRLMDQLINEQEREANNNISKFNNQRNEDIKPPSPVVVEQMSANISYTNQSVPKSNVDETENQRPELRRDMSYPAEEMIIEERKTISRPNKRTTENEESPNVIRRTMTPSKQFAEVKNVESPAPPTPPKVEPPALVKPADNLNSSVASDDSSSSSGLGPPAALLRWQRPRTKSEIKNPLQASEEQAKAAKRLSSTLPWRSENTFSLSDYSKDDSMMDKVTKSFEETITVTVPGEKKSSSYKFDDVSRQHTWSEKQEQERQPDEPTTSSIHTNFTREESLTAQSAAPSRKVGQVDSPDLMTLNITVPQQEVPLSPQEKFEQDQKRIRMQYEEEKKKKQKLQQEQEKANIDTDKFLQAMDSNIQTTKQEVSTNHITTSYVKPVQFEPKFTSEPLTFQLNSQNPGRPLIIDPRNRGDSSEMRDDSKPEFVFHVGLPQSDTNQPLRNQPAISSQDLLEQERQKIREEEKRKIEEEQKQWKQEQERNFKEQQDKLRADREQLQQEQERISREKALLEQEKLQPSRNYQSFTSPGSSLGSPLSSISHSPRSPPSALDPKYRESKAPPPTAPKPAKGEKARLTRDDLLAMNRSAKPLTKRPEGQDQSQSQDSLYGPGMREAPSKGELHSLNAVPKQKVRSSREWIGNEDKPFVIGKRSDLIHTSGGSNPHDHWVVQEAEGMRKREQAGRRANHDSSITARAGPTKPSESSLVSRFRGDIEPPPRSRYSGLNSTDLGLSARPLSSHGSRSHQFDRSPEKGITQFNAKTQPINYSSPNLSNTLPANFSFNANSSLPSKPPRSPNSETEQVIAVSGKQLCSHCGEELGFGAAMVIESLGLYYHVQCFRCCVCRTTLGNGAEGADVRVRVNKLHCKNCYSNDEAGLKFSKV